MNKLILTSALFSVFLFATPKASKSDKIVLSVPAIVCMSCSAKIEGILKKSSGVSQVAVDVETKKAQFSCNKAAGCDINKILASLSKAEYPATLIK